jgi:hypothetical protein
MSAVNLSFSFRTPLTFYHLWAHLLKGKLLTQGMSPKNKKTFITFMRIQQKKIPRPQHINEKEKEEIDAAVAHFSFFNFAIITDPMFLRRPQMKIESESTDASQEKKLRKKKRL